MEGKLHVTTNKGTDQYYIRTDPSDKNGIYIKKSNIELAHRLAQKEYDLKVIEAAQKEIKQIDKLKKLYLVDAYENAIDYLPTKKRKLVVPRSISDEQYIEEWLAEPYEKISYHDEGNLFDNGRGIMMRSKSEVLISKILDELGIPYKYEKPLMLDYKQVLPDFTLLDVRNRREIYLEHFGMMDDSTYVSKAMSKIYEYENVGIYLGDQLLVTYETRSRPIDTSMIRKKLSLEIRTK